MKITRERLKQIIKEEIEEAMRSRYPGFELQDPETGVTKHFDIKNTSKYVLDLLGIKPDVQRKTMAIRINPRSPGSPPTLVEPEEEEGSPERTVSGRARTAALASLMKRSTN